MLNETDKTYFDISGNLIYDPCIGDCYNVQELIPENQFAINNQVILNLNQSVLDGMAEESASCGLDAVSTVEIRGRSLALIVWHDRAD